MCLNYYSPPVQHNVCMLLSVMLGLIVFSTQTPERFKCYLWVDSSNVCVCVFIYPQIFTVGSAVCKYLI